MSTNDTDEFSSDQMAQRMRDIAAQCGLGPAVGDALFGLSAEMLTGVATRLRTRAARQAGYADAAHTDCEHYRAQGAQGALEDAAEEFEHKAEKLRAAIRTSDEQEQS